MSIAYNSSIGGTDTSRLGTLSDGTLRFIPTLWSSKINKRFYATTVFGEIANNDFSGEISGLGDKVVIMNSPTIAISDYAIGETLNYVRPPINKVELNINYAKSFSYQINDVEKYQTKADYMAEFADAAAQQLKVAVDASVLQNIYTSPLSAGDSSLYNSPGNSTGNQGVTAGVRSAAINLGAAGGTNGSLALQVVSGAAGTGQVNVFDLITRISAVLDEANIPESDRWLLVPPLFRTKLAQSAQAIALVQGNNEDFYRNGKMGQIDRFTVYVTNQLKRVTEGSANLTYVLAGHKSAMCFASQINKVESIPNPNDFGQLVRGLNVYGFQVVKPEAMAAAVVYF
jgi:P22 coat protein - gene protein 5